MTQMAANTSMLHVRMDDELRTRALEALGAMGLTASEAVRLLFHRIVADQAFPLEIKVPNAASRRAIAEVQAIIAEGHTRFANAEEMFAALENGE